MHAWQATELIGSVGREHSTGSQSLSGFRRLSKLTSPPKESRDAVRSHEAAVPVQAA